MDLSLILLRNGDCCQSKSLMVGILTPHRYNSPAAGTPG